MLVITLSWTACNAAALTRSKVVCSRKGFERSFKSFLRVRNLGSIESKAKCSAHVLHPHHHLISIWVADLEADRWICDLLFSAMTEHPKYVCYICAVFAQLCSQSFQITTVLWVLLFFVSAKSNVSFLLVFFFGVLFLPKTSIPCPLPYLKTNCSFRCSETVQIQGWFLVFKTNHRHRNTSNFLCDTECCMVYQKLIVLVSYLQSNCHFHPICPLWKILKPVIWSLKPAWYSTGAKAYSWTSNRTN